jgi:hypothetical protein
MALLFQVKERPHLIISPEDNMSAPAAIAAIGTSLWLKLFSSEMS